MAKMALHGMKLKRGNIVGIQRHNDRTNASYSNPDIDAARTPENYDLQPQPLHLYRAVMEKVEQRHNPNGRALRKDATVLCAFVLTSSKTFFKELAPEKAKEFFRIGHDYLSQFFGEENVVYSKVHMDEHTPHLHFGFVPLTDDNRLSAKDVMNRYVLLQLQKELPEKLQQAGFQIERGKEDSKATHLTVSEYKEYAEAEKARLAKELEGARQTLYTAAIIDGMGKEGLTGKITLAPNEAHALKAQAKAYLVEKSRADAAEGKAEALRREREHLEESVPKLRHTVLKLTRQLNHAHQTLRQVGGVLSSNPQLARAYNEQQRFLQAQEERNLLRDDALHLPGGD